MSATLAAKQLIRTFQEARQKKSLLHRVREYKRFVEIRHESEDFVVTTAAAGPDLLKVLQLRHEVFIEEWQGRRTFHGLDVDNYDFIADHLMIIDKRIDEVIGTYRLLSSHFTQNFYSCSEFDLQEFLRVPAVKLEMGRACVKTSYRDGNVIDLLWKGLAQYITRTKSEYMFGCSSIKSMHAPAISQLYRTMKDQGSWTDDFNIRPVQDYEFIGVNIHAAEPLNAQQKRELLPPLLRSYIHAGAKVYGMPARDSDFECTDLLTILEWKELNQRFQSRFK